MKYSGTKPGRSEGSACAIPPGVTKSPSLPVMFAQLALSLPILLLPWLFGGVQPRHQLWLAAGVLIALVCYLVAHTRARISEPPLPLAIIPLMLALMLGVLQLIPMRPGLLSVFSPQSRHLWETLLPGDDRSSHTSPTRQQATDPNSAPKSEVLNPKSEIHLAHSLGVTATASHHPITLYPASTRSNLSLLVLAVAVFFLGTRLFASDRVLLVLLLLVAVNGAALSFFGLAQQLRWNGLLFGRVPLTEGGTPFASFVNRNNGAGYLNMCLAASLGLTVWAFAFTKSEVRNQGPRTYTIPRWQKATRFISDLNAQKLFCLVLTMVVLGGLLCAMSRGAWIAATGAAVITVLACYFARRTGLAALLLVGVMAGGFGLVQWIGKTDAVQERFHTLFTPGDSSSGRLSHWQDSLTTASDFLTTGSGLGTYRFIYRMYEHNAFPVWFFHTENQYLEALVEGGIPGLLLVLSMIGIVGIASWHLLRPQANRGSTRQRRTSPSQTPTQPVTPTDPAQGEDPPPPDEQGRGGVTGTVGAAQSLSVPLGIVGIFALASQALHAAFDFGLYLPANMALLALISGIVVARVSPGAVPEGSGTRREGRRRSGRRRRTVNDPNLKSATNPNPKPQPDRNPEVRNAQPEIRNPKTEVRNLKSEIRNLKSSSPIIAALLAFATALGFNEIQSASQAHAALVGAELAGTHSVTTIEDVDQRIARIADALTARAGDAELHQRAAQLWIYRYRLEALANLKQLSSADADLNQLWSFTSPVVIHGRVHQWRREDQTFAVEELRRASDVQANLPNAVRHLLLARRSCPLLARTHLYLAETTPVISQYADDELDLQRARRLAEGGYDLLVECGFLESQAGRPDRACAAWRRAIEIRPERVGHILSVARVRMDLETHIDQLLPASPALLVEVIRKHLVEETQPAIRERVLVRARQLVETTANRKEEQNIYLRGAILALSHRYGDAIDQYTRALQLDPHQTTWRYELAQLLRTSGRLEDAQKQVAICVVMDPQNDQYADLQRDIVQQQVSGE